MPPNDPIPLNPKLRLLPAAFEAARFGMPEAGKLPRRKAPRRNFRSAVHNAG